MKTQMRIRPVAQSAVLVAMLAASALASAQTQSDQTAQSVEITAVVEKSADDWNRGDLEAFVQCYEQSPETTFVGNEVSRGTDAVLSRYKRAYPDAAHMGKTTFSELQARPLSADLAIVTGRFHLARGPQLGGDKSGIFTLVLRKGAAGWRIIHDHTSSSN